MVSRSTERARRVMVVATEEARSRRHEAVGPEHVLTGLLRDGGGSTAHVLEQLHASPERLRAEVERVLSETPESATGGEPTFSCSRWPRGTRRSARFCVRPAPTTAG